MSPRVIQWLVGGILAMIHSFKGPQKSVMRQGATSGASSNGVYRRHLKCANGHAERNANEPTVGPRWILGKLLSVLGIIL